MPPRRSSISSVSIIQIIAMVVLVLIAVIGLSFMFAPRKPAPPPTSRISYEARPKKSEGQIITAMPEYTVSETEPMPAGTVTEVPETAAIEEEPPLDLEISGVVLKAADQTAIANARIFVERKPDANDRIVLASMDRVQRRRMAMQFRERQSGSSDEKGTFTVNVTRAGVYEVTIQAPGYIPFVGDTAPVDEEQTSYHLEARLSSGASISGRVTEAGSSNGAAGVTVRVESVGDPSGVTDSDGNYTVEGLPTGELSVAVDLRESAYMAGHALPFQKVSIKRADERIKNINFEVEAAGVVWGHVLTMDNRPIESANVLLSSGESMFSQALSTIAKEARPIMDMTDSEGYYELLGVPFGQEWRLHASSDKEAPQLSDPFLLTPSQRNVKIDIFLFSGTNVSGQVTTEKNQAVPGAQIICIPGYGSFFRSMTSAQAFRNATSDKDGNFLIEELPAGEYQIFAQKEGYKVSPLGTPIYPDGYSDLQGVKVILSNIEEGSFAVYGQAVDDRGAGVDGVNIRLAGVTMGGFQGFELTTTTANNGKFRFDSVGSGQYSIVAEKDGYSPTTVRRVRLNDETRILMRQTAVVRGRVLAKGRSEALESYEVAAYPLSENTGAVNVMGMMSQNIRSEQFYAPDGSYELSINAGTYRLEATASGYTPARTEIKVEAGEILDGIDLILSDEGSVIAGSVYANDGGDIAGTRVTLLEASSPAEALMMLASNAVPDNHIQRTGSDGVFSFDSLPEGDYVIVAEHPGYPTSQSELIVVGVGDRQENIRIRFGSGGAIEGYVYSEGRAMSEAVILVVGNGVTQNVTTDQSGYYYLDGLASGEYQAMVTDISSGDLTSIYDARGVQLTVEEGVATRYDFGTQEGGRIEGQCIPGPVNLLGGRVVLVRPGMSQAPLGETVDVTQLLGQSVGINPAGSFLMEDVMPGEWQLDIFYFEMGIGNPLEVRYVHSEFINVEQGEVLPLVLNVNY